MDNITWGGVIFLWTGFTFIFFLFVFSIFAIFKANAKKKK